MFNNYEINSLANKVIGLAIEVHKQLGPGFIERIYQQALCYELNEAKIEFESEKDIIVKYKKQNFGYQRIDFLVKNVIILELKCVAEINEIHLAQLISYLKSADKRLGLILNFAKPKLEIKRVVNNF